MGGVTEVVVRVEVPRGGLAKRGADGAVEVLSPLPCPFNYGCVPGTPGGDGDPQDAVLLGARRPRGALVTARVWAVVRFVDAGRTDDKWVCGEAPPTAAERRGLIAFFAAYGRAKAVLNRLRGRAGETRLLGWEAA